MQNIRNKALLAVAPAATALFILFSVIGGWQAYTPVPVWDMWAGTVGFILNLDDASLSYWWAQHNEHRIVIARLLFWLDYRFFGGLSWFLILVNYLIVCLSILVFSLLIRERLARSGPGTDSSSARLLASCFVAAWLFQWMQWENLSWAFQSQFFLAQLLPLCGLYTLYRSSDTTALDRNFFLALFFGIASLGTMANGVLALPLMTFYALATRQGWKKILLLAVAAVGLTALYFADYQSPLGHGSLWQTLTEDPLGLAQYTLLYIGSPFFHLFGQGASGSVAALTASSLLAAITLPLLYRCLRHPRNEPLSLALLLYIVYLAGTALGTGGGRLLFGVEQAISSRYTTPALMAWAAFLVLMLPQVVRFFSYRKTLPAAAVSATIIGVSMVLAQSGAIERNHSLNHHRSVAALALELGIEDQEAIGSLVPYSPMLMAGARAASNQNLAAFGVYPYRDLSERINDSVTADAGYEDLPECVGSLDHVHELENDDRFVTVEGWLFNPEERETPRLLTFVDNAGTVIGFALAGKSRGDVAKVIHENAAYSGYAGYLVKNTGESEILIHGDTWPCLMTTRVPVPAEARG